MSSKKMRKLGDKKKKRKSGPKCIILLTQGEMACQNCNECTHEAEKTRISLTQFPQYDLLTFGDKNEKIYNL